MEQMIEKLKNRISQAARNGPILVAIDGNCTAGKTTVANRLAEVMDCNVFHMDDFFLRPHQRTPARYAEAGGNVDYERFALEVLEPLKAGREFSFRPFDCKSLTLKEPVSVPVKSVNIIEGTYSLHPYFGEPYGLKIFLSASYADQCRRILSRPAHLHRRFLEEWIPMEQRYFEEMNIAEKADLFF